jgi:curved DNA-binding protein CbpA
MIKDHENIHFYINSILNSSSHYEALGVDRNATPEEIRKAYLRLSRIVHPDKCQNAKAPLAFNSNFCFDIRNE